VPWHLLILAFMLGGLVGSWTVTMAIMTSRSPHER
jgi:hypothetical protein